MGKPHTPKELSESDVIDGLMAKHAHLIEQAAKVAATLSDVYGVSVPSNTTQSKPSASRATSRTKAKKDATAAVAVSAAYAGLSLQEAARKRLSIVKKAQTSEEIWLMLQAEGFQSASIRPSNAVHWALRKREKTHSDVMLVGKGKWGLTEWYSPEQRAEIEARLGGMSGRNSRAHSEQTKLGMELSRQRGVHIGRAPKLTPEVLDKVEEFLRAGHTGACAAHKFKVSPAAIFQYFTVRRHDGLVTVSRREPPRKQYVSRVRAEEQIPDLLTIPSTRSVN